jgi:hypothetical protein
MPLCQEVTRFQCDRFETRKSVRRMQTNGRVRRCTSAQRLMPLIVGEIPAAVRSQGRLKEPCQRACTLTAGRAKGIRLYLLMLWPSACVCSCPWLRVDDGLISCAEDTHSLLGSIAVRCEASRATESCGDDSARGKNAVATKGVA